MADRETQAIAQGQQEQEEQELTIPELRGAILGLNPLEFAELWTWLSTLAAQKLRTTFLNLEKESQLSGYGIYVDPNSVDQNGKEPQEIDEIDSEVQ